MIKTLLAALLLFSAQAFGQAEYLGNIFTRQAPGTSAFVPRFSSFSRPPFNAGPSDPNFSSLVALVAATAANPTSGTASYTEESSKAHVYTFRQNAVWTTANPPTGISSSLNFDGATAPTDSELTALGSTDWNVGSSNFTLEYWFYPTTAPPVDGSHGQNQVILGCGGATDLSVQMQFNDLSQFGGSFQRSVYGYLSNGGTTWDISSGDIHSGVTVTMNAWNHTRLVRNGSTFSISVGGVLTGVFSTLTSALSLHAVNATACAGNRTFQIGSSDGGDTQNFIGNIAGIRLYNGVALPTTFTPPVLPYPTH